MQQQDKLWRFENCEWESEKVKDILHFRRRVTQTLPALGPSNPVKDRLVHAESEGQVVGPEQLQGGCRVCGCRCCWIGLQPWSYRRWRCARRCHRLGSGMWSQSSYDVYINRTFICCHDVRGSAKHPRRDRIA